jgi:hypothetical protein
MIYLHRLSLHPLLTDAEPALPSIIRNTACNAAVTRRRRSHRVQGLPPSDRGRSRTL